MAEDQSTEQLWVETENEIALRDHIFRQDDREEKLIDVPEWGVQILIKALSGTARSEFLAFIAALDQHHLGDGEYWKRYWFEAARYGCLHPKTKRPIFAAADRDTLMDEHNGMILDMLGQTVTAFSKVDGTATKRAKKNLQDSPNTTTTTNSQSTSVPGASPTS